MEEKKHYWGAWKYYKYTFLKKRRKKERKKERKKDKRIGRVERKT
jgi:hypothetical protein